MLMLVAFTLGILFERMNARGICAAADGDWRHGTCIGPDLPHD